jgi:hypothetical protein
MGYELNKLLNLYGVRSATQAQYGGADDPGAPPEVPDDLYAHLPAVTGPKSEYEDSILRHFTPDERRNYLLNQQKMGIDPTQSYTGADGEIVDLRETYTDIFPVYSPVEGDPNYDSYMDYQKSVEEYLPRKEEFDYDQEQYNAYVDEWNNRMLETDIYRDRQFAGLTPSPPVDGPNPPPFWPILLGDSTQGMGEITSPGGPSSWYRPPGWDQGMGTQWDSPLNLPVYQQDVIPPYVPPITFPEAPVPPGGDTGNGGTVIDDTIYNDPIYDDPNYDAGGDGFKYGGPIRGYQEGDSVNVDPYSPLTNPYGQGQAEEDIFYGDIDLTVPSSNMSKLEQLKERQLEMFQQRRTDEKAYRDSKKDLLRHIMDIKKTQAGSGSDSEFYFRLAEAFSKPTRTGDFFESLGHASGVMAEDAAARRKRRNAAALDDLNFRKDLLELDRSTATTLTDIDKEELTLEKGALDAEIAAAAPKELKPHEFKAKGEIENKIIAGEKAIAALNKALSLNDNSYPVGSLKQKMFYQARRSGFAGEINQKARNTQRLISLVNNVVLSNLKATFGARPSDAELRELKKTLGLEAATTEARAKIFRDNIGIIQTQIDIDKARMKKYEGRE